MAAEASETARRILLLREGHRELLIRKMGRATAGALTVLESLYRRPMVGVGDIDAITGTSYAAAIAVIAERVRESLSHG